MTRLLNEEQGTAIVAALLILLLLTFVAISATDTTINEKAMLRSEALFEQNFSLAESAALEGLQKLASKDNDDIDDLNPNLISSTSTNKDLVVGIDSEEMADIVDLLDESGDGVIDKNDFYTDSNGNGKFDATEKLANPSFEKSDIGSETYRSAIMLPIAEQESLGITQTKSRLYRFDAIGLSEDNDGKSVILIGYKRRIEH
ncbi:hypothetical protein JWJ90_09000 [Desulfobulbus rhabdoformis]|uniref:hypothetical protein n=1 Tax=Desulfobulbus rhabdoformis TaxID=34032 RepID=UPI00196384E4|nr:hypothetical protein [Desulfobulbus rhabdoformis]MBM9614428.1 hypothetical protein [Desulfobulbus rhabdoformis]